jgi:hypothetical protein
MPEATYGRLDEVLRALGFSVRVVEEKRTRVYRHGPTDALILLPEQPATDPAIPHHLIEVRKTLEEYGIANPMEFARRLQKAE